MELWDGTWDGTVGQNRGIKPWDETVGWNCGVELLDGTVGWNYEM